MSNVLSKIRNPAAIGLGIGGVAGGLLADESTTGGVLRGAFIGSAIGAGVASTPYFKNYVKSTTGIDIRSGLFNDLASEAVDAYTNSFKKDLPRKSFGAMDSMLERGKPLSENAKQALKDGAEIGRLRFSGVENYFINPKKYAEKTLKEMHGRGVSSKGVAGVLSIGGNLKNGDTAFKNSESYKEVSGILDTFKNLSTSKKVGVLTTAVGQASYDSVNSHLITPTKDLLNKARKGRFKDITLEEASSLAFNSVGAYEMYQASDFLADGEYKEASSTLGYLSLGKLLYGQASAYRGAKHALADKGLRFGEVADTLKTGVMARKFEKGFKEMSTQEKLNTGIINLDLL